MRACWCLEKAELGKELAPADLPPKKLGKAGALLPALVTGSSDAEAAAHSARCIQECGEEGARLMQPIESLPEQPPALGQGGFGLQGPDGCSSEELSRARGNRCK